MAVDIVKWLWLFGDGAQSTEPTPVHTYNTPGVYTVTCTVWDEFGNEYTLTKEAYIYVYDYTIGPDGLLTGLTDFCFKHAVQPHQGQGIAPVGGSHRQSIDKASPERETDRSAANQMRC